MWFGGDDVLHTGKFALDGIKTIWVRSSSHDICFFHTEETELVIKEYGSDGNAKVEKRGEDTLCIETSEEKHHFWFNTGIYIGKSCKTELYVPEGFRGQIYAESGSGDIVFDSAWSVQNLQIKTHSGDISIKNMRAEHILVESESGDVDVEEAWGDRQFFTHSGDICVERGTGCMHAETQSGDMDIKELDAGTKIGSASGDICAGFRTVGGQAEIFTTSGDIDVKIAADSCFGLEATTVSGDIVTHLEHARTNAQGENHVVAWTGSDMDKQKTSGIHVSSVSGDISLHN